MQLNINSFNINLLPAGSVTQFTLDDTFIILTCSYIYRAGGSGSSSAWLRAGRPSPIPGIRGVEIFLHSFVFILVLGSTHRPIKCGSGLPRG